MMNQKYIFTLAVLILALAVSGCTDSSSPEEETTISENVEMQEISVADETLNDEMVGVTDSEIQDLEAELAELEALMGEMDLGEDISIEEI
ncbi:hypothetical protein V7O62_04500 [Methanolobus sp. ZRKC2]|uniref:hypothetical protein n=1 Tax=Methanolobus sp. ZRKC2 TaxID=3125783 RepID=UPI003246E250